MFTSSQSFKLFDDGSPIILGSDHRLFESCYLTNDIALKSIDARKLVFESLDIIHRNRLRTQRYRAFGTQASFHVLTP